MPSVSRETAIVEDHGPVVDRHGDVGDTTISFEDEPPTVDEMRARLGKTLQRFPWLVSLDGEAPHHIADFAAHVKIQATDVNARWQAEMSEFFELPGDARPDTGLTRLHEVFHLD